MQLCHLENYFHYHYDIDKKASSVRVTTSNDINIVVDFHETRDELKKIPYLNIMWPNGLHASNVIFEEDPAMKCIKFRWENKPKGESERYLFSTGTVVSILDNSSITVYHYNGTVFKVGMVHSNDNTSEESQDIPLDKMAGGDAYSVYIDDSGEGDFRSMEHLHFEKQLLKRLSKYILLDWKHFSVVTPDGKSSNYSNEVKPDDNHVIFNYKIFDYQEPSLVHLAEDSLEMKWTEDALNTKVMIESRPMYFVTRLLSDRDLLDSQLVEELHFDRGDVDQEEVCL